MAVFVVCAMNLTLSTIIRLNVNHFGQTMRRCVCVCGLVAAHYANGKHKIDLCNLFVIATMPYIGQHERMGMEAEDRDREMGRERENERYFRNLHTESIYDTNIKCDLMRLLLMVSLLLFIRSKDV